MIRQCMGGWCHLRDRCSHYAAPNSRFEPAERLCEPGEDGEAVDSMVRVHRPVGTRERLSVPSLLRPADVFDGLPA